MATKKTSGFNYPPRKAYFALTIATFALIINFWAWSLLSPLGSKYASELSLNPLSLSLLLAVPVIVGSIGRIILGMITDKFGGRIVFAVTCLLAMIPVIALAFSDTYMQLIFTAVFLGIGGAAFVIGIPYVSAWFPPEKRGLVLGIYSMGNVGTAVSGFLTPRLESTIGRQSTYYLVASLLFVMSTIFVLWGKNAPGWKSPKGSALKRFALATKSRITWDLAVVYIITFGAFVAFGVYLPVLLKVSYGLSLTDAATRAAGFVLLATVARPIGGWLSDKIGGKRVIRVVLLAIVFLATSVALQPTLQLRTTITYLSLAFVLGLGNGAVFALVGKLSKPDSMGSVTGIVGACGGLGGFLPPLILGFTYQRTHSYSIALIMLSFSALLAFFYINHRFKDTSIYKVREV
jgi:MFS transporter, NNP family, nitrate/nitrite transporter